MEEAEEGLNRRSSASSLFSSATDPSMLSYEESPTDSLTKSEGRSSAYQQDDEALEPLSVPKDYCLVAYMIFLIQGVGVLFPWNAYITASDYFDSLYDPFPFEFALSLAYNYPSLIALLLTVKFGPRVPFTIRIVGTLIVCFLALIIIPAIDALPIPTTASLVITLTGVLISGIAVAILFGSILGLSALFPPEYTGAVMIGNGIAGVAAGLLRVFTKAALPGELQISAILYFSIAGIVIVLCIISYFILLRLPITRHFMAIAKHHSRRVSKEEREKLTASGNYKRVRYIPLLRKLWLDAAVVFGVFFVTLSLFPGMTLEIKSNSGLSNGWFGVLTTLTFQVFDFVGRTLPRFVIIFPRRLLWIPAFARVAFYALFILCILQIGFVSIGWTFGFMVLFAISNGYTGTLAMMYGPTGVEEHERESAGLIMSFFLNLGIFLAVHFSVALLVAVKGPGSFKV